MIDLIVSRCSIHELLLCFILLHISNGSVSASLVGYVFYSADLMSVICISHYYLMVHRYIYSRYSPVFPTLYQLYYSLSSSTLISSSSLYLKLQPCQVPCGAGAEWPRVEQSCSRIEGGWQPKVRNNLGLSLCAVSRSAVMCVVADFRRTELLSGVQEKSGIDW